MIHQVANPVQLFVTGEIRAPNSETNGNRIARLGGGAYWSPTNRLIFFGRYVWGLTASSPDTTLNVGLSFAF